MEKILIRGGRRLCGTVTPEGSKNAALPLIFATLVTDGISVLRGVPDIADVKIALRLIRDFGADVTAANGTVTVDTRNLQYKKPDRTLTSSIRASSYLIGASLARFGKFDISEIGGCNFCNRPIDMHVDAALTLGAEKEGDMLISGRLVGTDIVFEKVSVGATINALIMASTAKGITRIFGAAKEPHVRCLIDFLSSAGARIFDTPDCVIVEGCSLHGGSAAVIPDMIEAGSYLLFGAMTGGKVTVKGGASLGLESFLQAIADGGVTVITDGNDVTLCGYPHEKIYVTTSPFPGYPTDLQPQIAPFMALGCGGIINEAVWQNRFSYLDSLARFGLRYMIRGSSAYIEPSDLSPSCTYAADLRGGAAAVACALAVHGESIIEHSEIIARGYARLERRLSSLGAEIKIIKEN